MSTLIPLSVRGNAPVYDPTKSTTAKKIDGMTFRQSYAGGSYVYSGVVYTDAIKIGSLTFSNYAFEVCETSKTQVGGPPYGTFGLNIDPNGMPTKPDRIKSWFPAVMGYLHAPLFAVDYHRSTSKGTFDFGFIDENKYTGSIGYTSVLANNGGQWVVSISGFAVGTTFIKRSFNTLVDTGGVATLQFPRWAIDRYFAQVPNSTWNEARNSYQFPCDNVKYPLPDIVFGVGDSVKLTIPGKNLEHVLFNSALNQCGTYITAGSDDQVLWAKKVIENLYVVFDYGNRRMGFANKVSF
ncbi:hypothetical protein IFR05_008876 [Cadophora sp. M221]|nr:hypothetical protein IFR05_008876 [Cadophora sp. M221]